MFSPPVELSLANIYTPVCGCLIGTGYAFAMKTVEKWRWNILWAGRWTTTRIPYTEAEVRREHPEAVRIDNTRVEVEMPGTQAEADAFQRPARRAASQGEP